MATVTLDANTMMMLGYYRAVDAAEPLAPDPDQHDGHLLAEVALRHYEWERTMNAVRLLLSIRLLSLALDQVPPS